MHSSGGNEQPEEGLADEEFETSFELGEDSFVLIPEENYWVQFVKTERYIFFNSPKLYVWFQVVEQGPYLGARLFRAYNLYKPLRRGSDLFKELVLLSGERARKRTRLST